MRNNQRIFIVLFTFFTVVALGSLLLLTTKGSVFNRNRDSFGAQPAVLDNATIIANDAASVESTEEVVQPVAEAEPVAEPEPVAEEPAATEPAATEQVAEEPAGIRYFTFTVSTKTTVLNVRENPGLDAAILKKLPKNTKGYILKPGNDWSFVRSENGTEGYCSNEYLDITEVTAEDFPEDLRDRVEAPTEELPVSIFGE